MSLEHLNKSQYKELQYSNPFIEKSLKKWGSSYEFETEYKGKFIQKHLSKTSLTVEASDTKGNQVIVKFFRCGADTKRIAQEIEYTQQFEGKYSPRVIGVISDEKGIELSINDKNPQEFYAYHAIVLEKIEGISLDKEVEMHGDYERLFKNTTPQIKKILQIHKPKKPSFEDRLELADLVLGDVGNQLKLIHTPIFTPVSQDKEDGELRYWTAVHGDIKPSNILFNQNTNKYQVIDYGTTDTDKNLRQDTTFRGSLKYAAPEQMKPTNNEDYVMIKGLGRLDNRADVYALGGVLYFILTGENPFDTKFNEIVDKFEREEALSKIIQTKIQGIIHRKENGSITYDGIEHELLKKNPKIKPELAEIVAQALWPYVGHTAQNKTGKVRFQDVGQFQQTYQIYRHFRKAQESARKYLNATRLYTHAEQQHKEPYELLDQMSADVSNQLRYVQNMKVQENALQYKQKITKRLGSLEILITSLADAEKIMSEIQKQDSNWNSSAKKLDAIVKKLQTNKTSSPEYKYVLDRVMNHRRTAAVYLNNQIDRHFRKAQESARKYLNATILYTHAEQQHKEPYELLDQMSAEVSNQLRYVQNIKVQENALPYKQKITKQLGSLEILITSLADAEKIMSEIQEQDSNWNSSAKKLDAIVKKLQTNKTSSPEYGYVLDWVMNHRRTAAVYLDEFNNLAHNNTQYMKLLRQRREINTKQQYRSYQQYIDLKNYVNNLLVKKEGYTKEMLNSLEVLLYETQTVLNGFKGYEELKAQFKEAQQEINNYKSASMFTKIRTVFKAVAAKKCQDKIRPYIKLYELKLKQLDILYEKESIFFSPEEIKLEAKRAAEEVKLELKIKEIESHIKEKILKNKGCVPFSL